MVSQFLKAVAHPLICNSLSLKIFPFSSYFRSCCDLFREQLICVKGVTLKILLLPLCPFHTLPKYFTYGTDKKSNCS